MAITFYNEAFGGAGSLHPFLFQRCDRYHELKENVGKVELVPESIVAGELALTLRGLTLHRALPEHRRPQFVLVLDFPRLMTNGERNNLNVVDT